MTTQVGDLKKGINPLSISQLTFTDKHVNTAVKAGFLSGILALAVRTCFFSSLSHGILFIWMSFLRHGKCFSPACVDGSQEGIAVGRSLALIKNEQIDGNKEMVAFGIMNIAGSFTSCYLTTGES